MIRYFVNTTAQRNGDHEVHQEGCRRFPDSVVELGLFSNCGQAVFKARSIYPKANGCYWCCGECHTF